VLFLPFGLTGKAKRAWNGASNGWYQSCRHQPFEIASRGEVQSFRQALAQYALHGGYAGFWQTKILNLAYPTHRVTQLEADGIYIRPWLTNVGYYLTESQPELGRGIPHYDFVFQSSRSPFGGFASDWWLRFGSPAAVVECGQDKVLVYNRPSDVGFRNFTRVPALIEGKRSLPLSAQEPCLRVYKRVWTPVRPGESVLLQAGGRQTLAFERAVPVAGRVLEIGLDNGDVYRVTFLAKGEEVGQTTIRSYGWGIQPGINSFFLLLEDVVKVEQVDAVAVEPIGGDGCYAVGPLPLPRFLPLTPTTAWG
jgi:hypothetical protein